MSLDQLTPDGVSPRLPRVIRACWLCVACFLAAACGGAPSAPTTATTTPGGSSPPSQGTNRAPTVTLAFQGASSCVPIPPLDGMSGRYCTLPVIAQASDPDGDALTYKWSGCTTYGSPPNQSTCYVKQVGSVTSTVEVSDGHGNTATASITGHGVNPPPDFVNHPPSVSFGYVVPIKVPPDSRSLEALGSIGDADEGELCGGGDGTAGSGLGGCPYLTAVSVSGDCETDKYAVLGCYCLGGLTVDIYRTKASGTCTLKVTVRDSWGLPTTSAFSISYDQTGGPFKAVPLLLNGLGGAFRGR